MSSANDLFAVVNPATPLAERLRPKNIGGVIGQRHLLGPGKPLAVAFASGKPHSMILWGPPGVGKTTLARLMADAFNAEFIALSAVLSGVKDIRDAIAQAEATLAQSGRHTILFVDEVHRFNKGQQDAFLPFVEKGLVTFIGATTENPSFEVNSALLSRATVYVLEALSADELSALLDRALAAAMPAIAISASARDSSALFTSNDGFSVVAPTNTNSPDSTCGKNASCWLLLKRCTSSTKITVRRPCACAASARSTASRMSLTPPSTADMAMNCASKASAISRASVVLPVPGGPQRIIECSRPDSKATRSGLPGPSRCCWPITSSSDLGRSRSASGAAPEESAKGSSREAGGKAGASAARSPGAHRFCPGPGAASAAGT